MRSADGRTLLPYGFYFKTIVANELLGAFQKIEEARQSLSMPTKKDPISFSVRLRDEALAKGEVVVVKVSKPNQDERFDIPTIGEKTLQTLAGATGGILAFEANKTIVTDKNQLINLADKLNVCLIAI